MMREAILESNARHSVHDLCVGLRYVLQSFVSEHLLDFTIIIKSICPVEHKAIRPMQ